MTTNRTFNGYIGTYTKGKSEGIYRFTLDTSERRIANVTVAAKIENPTYLTISANSRYLYSVAKEGKSGGIASYSISDNGELTLINSQLLDGSPPCHVSVDSKNRFILSANYHKGTVESHLINQEDGSIQPAASMIKHQGSGPDPRQEKPHTHFAGVTPNEKYITVVELGTDSLITYEVSEDGKLTEVSRLAIRPGSGPRHLVFHPNKPFAFIMTEFSSEVIALDFHPDNGVFFEKQTISTLPEGYSENNQGSAIHISLDGRFIYTGNRGHNSIAVFSVNQETGEVSFVEHVSTEGDWPRDFVLDPSGNFIVASNQESSNLTLFARDEATGKLTLLQADIKVPDPVCVTFLNL